MNISNNYRRRHAAHLRNLAFLGIGLLAIILLPTLLAALFAAPKTSGLLCAAAGLPLLCLAPDDGGGYGGSTVATALHKTGEALSALDTRIKSQETRIADLEGQLATAKSELTDVRKRNLQQIVSGETPEFSSRSGRRGLSAQGASELAASFVLHAAQSGRLDAIIPDANKRSSIYNMARGALGITKALSTTEVPLPTHYGSELKELIAEFGVVRKGMFGYPLSGGVDKPPRMGTRPAFASIAMAAEFPELKPTFGFASLEPHKIGGIVIPPRELDEQSIVPLGQFLARYGAVEFARAEDTWGFLADGSANYEEVKGVAQIASENGKIVTLANTKTAPSDAELDDFRNLRTKVSTAALGKGAAYFISRSWEGYMRSFNTINDPVFQYRFDGTATLDGFPIVWTEVLQPYGTTAAAGTYLAAFGRLDYWWFGERGTPRIDTSAHVFFRNDLIAVRFIEEIDFDYCALDAMAVLKTAAA